MIFSTLKSAFIKIRNLLINEITGILWNLSIICRQKNVNYLEYDVYMICILPE